MRGIDWLHLVKFVVDKCSANCEYHKQSRPHYCRVTARRSRVEMYRDGVVIKGANSKA